MPRPNKNAPEKSKDFIGAMKRLIKKLAPFKVILIISLILAATSAILSLITPDKLSDFTDTITAGITPKTSVLEDISKQMMLSFNEDNFNNKMPLILSSGDITDDEKNLFLEIIASLSNVKEDELLSVLNNIPNSVLNILLNEITIDNQTISITDQITMFNLLEEMGDETKTENALALIDQLPKTVYELVKPSIDMDKIMKIFYIMATLYLLSSLFNYIESYAMATVSNNFAKSLRSSISKKINVLPLKYFDNHENGDVLSRVTNDVDMIAQNLNQSLASLVSSITLFIGSIFMMFTTNWIMAITAILSSLFGFVFMFIILSKSQKYFNQRQIELGKINGYIEEMYSGHNVVKAYNGTKESIERFNKLNNKLYEANRKSQFLSGLMGPFMGFIGNFGYVAVCIVGALLASNQSISFGVIVAFMIYVRLFTRPLSEIAQAMTEMQSTAAASERVFDFLDEEEMSNEKELNGILDKNKVKGNIEFKNVKFGYDDKRIIIKDFSTKVKPGQKIAIVGPTGAGKTTMVNLLMKFYEINNGDILIDGVSTKTLTRENVHELFCMVLQDTWLFEGTIKDNIQFNKENISQKEIWDACKTVGIDHFVKTLPNGINYNVDDSDTISSGQKQLFTIARGMLEDAPFLILDEATSNVDTRTEELVQKAMDKLTVGKTSFIIAHRLSTIKNADLILVMNEGNIIEQGTHKELMKQNGFYAKLYNSQFQN